MKVTELCTKALSLLDHCLHDLQQHFVKVQEWFNVIWPIRQQLSKMEKDVAQSIERQAHFSSDIRVIWNRYQDHFVSWLREDYSTNTCVTDSPNGSSIPAVVESSSEHLLPFSSSVDPMGANRSSFEDIQSTRVPLTCSDSSDRGKEKAYKKELVSKLKENLKSLGDETHYVRNAIQEGADLIKQFEEVLSIQSLDSGLESERSHISAARSHDR